MIFGNEMGVFEGKRTKRSTPFEAGVPASRGGGRHMAFNRVRFIPGTQDFMAVGLKPFPGSYPGDIRSMGPYELPDYSEAHSSAEGIGQIPGLTPSATPGAPAGSQPWYKQLLNYGQQAYQAYESFKKKPEAPTAPSSAFVYTPSADTGMSTTTIVLLVGGGVAVLGVIGFLLLRK